MRDLRSSHLLGARRARHDAVRRCTEETMKPPRTFTVPELVLWSLIVWCIAMVVAAIIISERAW